MYWLKPTRIRTGFMMPVSVRQNGSDSLIVLQFSEKRMQWLSWNKRKCHNSEKVALGCSQTNRKSVLTPNSKKAAITRYGFRQILHTLIRNATDPTSDVSKAINRKYICDFRGVRIRIFAVLGSGQYNFQRIGTKFPTELKLSNIDFVLSGKWDKKYKSDFRDVQIPVSVSISALWNHYTRKSLRIFTKFCTLFGCG